MKGALSLHEFEVSKINNKKRKSIGVKRNGHALYRKIKERGNERKSAAEA